MAFAADMERPARVVNAMSQPARPRHPGRGTLLALVLSLPLALGGCSFFDSPQMIRGHRVTEEQLAQLVPGVQSRNDVQTLLGSPTARSTFDDSAWYYISAVSRARPLAKESISQQRVVVLEFGANGKLTQVRELGQDDAANVSIVQRETPVPGNERTLMQALFGNVGRFNPLGSAGLNNTTPGASQPNSTRIY